MLLFAPPSVRDEYVIFDQILYTHRGYTNCEIGGTNLVADKSEIYIVNVRGRNQDFIW